jgi:deoxyribodipyrimidine photo-lyase
MNKEKINLIWLKRDIRLHDNEAISSAIKSGKRFLIFYAFEKILLHDLHYNERHWDFIKQSIVDINKELIGYKSKVLSVSSDIIGLCNQIQNFYAIDTVYSHIETGILTTYVRDKEFKRYCRNNNINWKENINNGVQRGLLHREKWYEDWECYMQKKQEVFNPQEDQILKLDEIK